MQKTADLYNLTQQLQGAVYQAGMKHFVETTPDDQQTNSTPPHPLLMIRQGYAESVGWMMVQLYEFEPETLTVEKFRVRAVYSAPRLAQALLELIASEKWADRANEDYKLTKAGHAVIHNLLSARYQKLINFCPLPQDELAKLVEYSEHIFATALETTNEQSTWCLRYSQKRKPTGNNISDTSKMMHVASDMNAWRDDTHMQAYREAGIDGMTWEAFSFIDDGNANTAETLFDQLAYRGWTIAEWQDALNLLHDKGWITCNENVHQSSSEGRSIRQQVEQRTDELFYAPWNALNQEQQVEYISLLHKLHDSCIAMLSQ